jgi:hypothetical protein
MSKGCPERKKDEDPEPRRQPVAKVVILGGRMGIIWFGYGCGRRSRAIGSQVRKRLQASSQSSGRIMCSDSG